MSRRAAWQLAATCLRRRVNTTEPTYPLLLQQQQRRGYADEADLKKTALYDFHVENGGKMVPFAGWSMPIQYKDSIMESTTHCRSHGSIFDVSHMCGLSLKGKDVIPYVESLVVGDIAGLAPGTGTLSVFTNESGGVIDDTVVTKVTDEHVYMVVNAACRDKDLTHMASHLKPFQESGKDVGWHVHDERSLLAVQGPLAAPTLQKLTKADVSQIYFGDFKYLEVNGSDVWVTRTGYTGEDGFEISIPNEDALALTKALIEQSQSDGGLRLCGLGPRDSLRLEAGLCLYGNDLEADITPVEAGLKWTIGKRRRDAGDFPGAETILKQLKDGVSRRRIGLTIGKGAPARTHTEILSEDGTVVGEVTSGGFSPCLKKNIAMGYVQNGSHKSGTPLKVNVRGKVIDSVVTKMPFVKTTYHKKP